MIHCCLPGETQWFMQHLLWRLRQSQYRRSLYTEYAVCVGHQLPGGTTIPVSKKKKCDTPFPHPRPLAPCLRLKAKRLWITMPMKRHQRCGTKKKQTNMKTKPVRHIHNPVKLIGVLSLITCFNVGNFTTTNASNILSEIPCSLTKVSHG